MPIKTYYNAAVSSFLDDDDRILGVLTVEHHHALEEQQRWAWLQQISILKSALANRPNGQLFLELYIPRMGKRADAALITENILFVIEFKVGASEHTSSALYQVEDYALDLKNFHEGSHAVPIVPVLVSTNAAPQPIPDVAFADDLVALPIGTNGTDLGALIEGICCEQNFQVFDTGEWMTKGYRPTPTIVEAAEVLYRSHTGLISLEKAPARRTSRKQTTALASLLIGLVRTTLRPSASLRGYQALARL